MAQQILHNIRPKQIICDQNIQSCYRLLIDPVAIQNQRKKTLSFQFNTGKKTDIMNYRFLTTETNSKALYIFPVVF